MGLVGTVLGTLRGGRPPEPRPEVLPPPISLAESRAIAAIGHADSRSDTVFEHADLGQVVAGVYRRGLRTGGFFQTINAGSSGHIEVLGNVDGVEQLVGWITEVPRSPDEDSESVAFQYREGNTPLARFRTSELHRASVPGDAASTSPEWRLSSLERVLDIAAKCNFQVAGICQNRAGDHAHITLLLGPKGELGRGTITALPGKQTTYLLSIAVGPKPPPPVDDY